MHIPLAKLTMTSLKESFCPVKKLQVVWSTRYPFSSYLLLQVSFCVQFSSALCISWRCIHFECCCCYWCDFLRVALIIYYLTFLMIDTFRFFFSNSTCDVVPIFCEFVTSLICHSFVWVLYYLNDKIIIYMHAHTCISIHLFPILIILSIKFLKFPNLNFWSNQGFVPCIPLPYKAWARSHVMMQN